MEEGITTHPMVIHILEYHQGKSQETVFRLLSKHRTALDQQVMEEVSANPLNSLNLKSEWGGSKLPGLQVTRPKGVAWSQEKAEGMKRVRIQDNKEATETGPDHLPE